MPTVEIGGSSIYYRVFGEPSNPALFLIHGLYGDSSTTEPLARALATRLRVFPPDMLGHGRSARPPVFSLADQGRTLNGLVATLGYDSAALLGMSMGSYVAAQAAILEPHRTSALLLVTSKAHGTTSSTLAHARRMGIDLSSATQAETVALMAGALWSPATSSERRAEIMASTGSPVLLTAEKRAAVDQSLAGFDLRPGLGSIAAPTLVVSGRADGLNLPEAGDELARLIPHARFGVCEKSGHMLPLEEPDRLVRDAMTLVPGAREP